MIIILTQCYPPRIGGIENLIYNLSLSLSNYDKVLVFADQHNFINERSFDKKFKQNLIIKRFGGIKYFRKRNKFRELKKIIEIHKINAIISDSWKSIEYPLSKLRNKEIPIFSLVHGNEVIVKNDKHRERIIKTLSLTDKIICNSDFTEKLVHDISSNLQNTKVIYPGVMNVENLKEKELKLINGNPTLLTLARLEKRKGHKKILYAINKLKDQYPNIRYIIAGDGEEKFKLKNIVNDLDITNNVIFIGSITDAQKKYIFKQTDLMIMPTIDETKKLSVEGFGIAYIEAARFGIPSIASNIGGTKEAVIHNKTGLVLEDLNNLENSIRELIEDKDKRKLLGQNAKKRALDELDWNNQVKKYLNLINNKSK